MSVSGFRWWDHKPLLRTVFQGWSQDPEVAGFSYLFHFDQLPIGPIKIVCLQQEKWISEGKTFDILCLFCRVVNLFVREKDDYIFLYERYYLFSYIIDVSVDYEPHFYK